jgi:hypothetical protein
MSETLAVTLTLTTVVSILALLVGGMIGWMATQTPQKKTRTRKPKAKLPPNPFMNEILDLVSEQKTAAKKVQILKEYENDALKALFVWNFDESVISLLPTGDVPYKPNDSPLGTDHSSLRREWKNFYVFEKQFLFRC